MTEQLKEKTHNEIVLELDKIYNEKVNHITELKQQQCEIQSRVITGLEDMYLAYKKLNDVREKYLVNIILEKENIIKEISSKYTMLNNKLIALASSKINKLEPIIEEPLLESRDVRDVRVESRVESRVDNVSQ